MYLSRVSMLGHYVEFHPSDTRYIEYYRTARIMQHPYFCEEGQAYTIARMNRKPPTQEEITKKENTLKHEWDAKDKQMLGQIEDEKNGKKIFFNSGIDDSDSLDQALKAEETENDKDLAEIETKKQEMQNYISDFEKKYGSLMKKYEK